MKLKSKIVAPVLVILLIATVSITILNFYLTKSAVDRMVNDIVDSNLGTLLSQVERSEKTEQVVLNELNKKNLTLARVFAEVVRLNGANGILDMGDAPFFQSIAELLDMAEINVTDDGGVIIGSNLAENYGFGYDTADSTRKYMQILNGGISELVEEPRASAVSGDMYQYIGVPRADGDGFVQVGIGANVVQEFRGYLDVVKTAADMRVGSSGFASILSGGVVTYSKNPDDIGKDKSKEEWYAQVSSGRGKTWVNMGGERQYAGYANINGMTLLVLFPGAEYDAYLTPVRDAGVIVSIASFAIMFALIIMITGRIVKPIKSLSDKLRKIASGELGVPLAMGTGDEIGELSRSMDQVVSNFHSLAGDVEEMSNKLSAEGELGFAIDESKYSGGYKRVVAGINDMLHGYVNEVNDFMDCMKEFSDGNFDADIPKLPGKKAVMNENLDVMRSNLKSIAQDIGALVRDASAGKLDSLANDGKYSGGWAELLRGLNNLMEAIARPVNETIEALKYMSEGDFNHKVAGEYQGDFLTIKKAINNTVANVASYIDEISSVLCSIADSGNLDQTITRGYAGNFSAIKNALNNILDKFNSIISDIYAASEQVAAGAKVISDSSMALAHGAGEQAGAIEELNASVRAINESTSRNVKDAQKAENLSADSRNNAQTGDRDMKEMLASMEGINQSSQKIAGIIKLIDDIAFQTNLLALNAAVEAARAGENGKGFSVVAEEVRSLAVKSLDASKEISGLIDESGGKVQEGSQTAGATAKTLQVIVNNVTEVSGIITNISESSSRQADAIGKIAQSLSKITGIGQNNTATSEETASASQQLSSQADMLKQLAGVFSLKRAAYAGERGTA